ncbi:hypothetical protein [Parasphingorhabdus flavimaris]|uniref:hypothetical protein n=1 Tax=Parasphingorhabdus flavimaris TaxID=266812 RepID=UPI00300318C8
MNFRKRLAALEGTSGPDYSSLTDAELIDRIKGVHGQIALHGVALPAWPDDNDLTPEFMDTVSEVCAASLK